MSHSVPGALSVASSAKINRTQQWTALINGANPPRSGLLRVYWKITRIVSAQANAIPRIKIGWAVNAVGHGEESNFELIADARSGDIQVNATALNIYGGWDDEDIEEGYVGGEYLIQASIFDTGSSNGIQRATFTRQVVLDAFPGPQPIVSTVSVPKAVTGMRWFPTSSGSSVTIEGADSSGSVLQYYRTGAPVAGTPPPLIAVEPEVAGGSVSVTNLADAAPKGRLVFYYFDGR
jgi:hypothetical protein